MASDQPDRKLAYESADTDRAASASPTEQQLEQELPTGRDAARHDPYAALRNPRFQLYISGFFFSVIAAQMQTVAARYELYLRTNSELSLGLLGLVLAIPMLLLTLPAGQLADTLSRRRLMIVTMLGSSLAALGLAWVSHSGAKLGHPVAAMYTLLAFGSTVATLGLPARTALMPQLVPVEEFSNAVTWNSSIFESASVIGPPIAGFICVWNIAVAYVLAAVLFAACAITITALPEPPRAQSVSRRPGMSDLVAGIRYVWQSKLMLGAMTLDLFAVLLGGAVFLLPVYAKSILHVGAVGFGFLTAAPSVGAISMAMIQAHRPPLRRAGRALLVSVAAFGVATIIFGLSTNFWLSLLMLILVGAFDNISVVVRHTLIQLSTPEAMRGRVSAVNQIFIGSSNELGGLESGLTAWAFGTVASVVGGGIGTIVVVTFVALLFTQVRRLGSLTDIRPE